MARSKPSLPGTAAASGAGRGGGGRGGRGGGRDAHDPAKIARAGLGNGGTAGATAAGGGGAMFGWPRGAPRSALPLVSLLLCVCFSTKYCYCFLASTALTSLFVRVCLYYLRQLR